MKKPPLTLILAAFLVLCLAATACAEGYGTQVSGSQRRQDGARQDQATNNVTPTASATVPALTRDALRTAEYAAGFPAFGSLQRDRIGAQDPIAFGDLNGNGVDDGAVVLLLVDGNAAHRYLAAVLNENGVPRHVASAFLGHNIGIDSVTIADGIVTLQTKQLGPNDPNCCPTKEVVATFRLDDNDWKLVAETPPGQVTANFHVLADANTIAAALEELRSTEVGDTVAAWFLDSGGRVAFDDALFQALPDIPEVPFAIGLDLQENRIAIGMSHRVESVETLAAWLAGSMTQSISLTLEGDPSSVAACLDLIQLAYHARAAVWHEFYGDEGKPNPNSQEAFLNRNLQRTINGTLAGWVRGIPFYRQSCAQFAAPPPPTPTPVSTPLPPAPTPATVGGCLTNNEVEYLAAWHSYMGYIDPHYVLFLQAMTAASQNPRNSDLVEEGGKKLRALRWEMEYRLWQISNAPTQRTARLETLTNYMISSAAFTLLGIFVSPGEAPRHPESVYEALKQFVDNTNTFLQADSGPIELYNRLSQLSLCHTVN
ncbi:MAG: hypothetical protein OXE05_07440 [Chloroflexi bacterium]|nr:hypothetical protein [Chloroflexota bacterium]